jgi:site-specific DNA-methyltransferase (adenine-specific)
MTDFEKIVIGDCTLYKGDSYELLAHGVFGEIGGICSDPPYGIGYQHSGNSNSVLKATTKTAKIYGDDKPFDPSIWIDSAPIGRDEKKRILLFGVDHYKHRLPEYGTLLAWDKHLGVAGDDSFCDCEWAWVARDVKREVFRHLWKGLIRSCDKYEGRPGIRAKRIHVSQKPVELMRWCLDKLRPLSGLPVLDPFMGSGTTGVACLTLGLKFIGCEFEQEHFDNACQRIRDFHEGRLFP